MNSTLTGDIVEWKLCNLSLPRQTKIRHHVRPINVLLKLTLPVHCMLTKRVSGWVSDSNERIKRRYAEVFSITIIISLTLHFTHCFPGAAEKDVPTTIRVYVPLELNATGVMPKSARLQIPECTSQGSRAAVAWRRFGKHRDTGDIVEYDSLFLCRLSSIEHTVAIFIRLCDSTKQQQRAVVHRNKRACRFRHDTGVSGMLDSQNWFQCYALPPCLHSLMQMHKLYSVILS